MSATITVPSQVFQGSAYPELNVNGANRYLYSVNGFICAFSRTDDRRHTGNSISYQLDLSDTIGSFGTSTGSVGVITVDWGDGTTENLVPGQGTSNNDPRNIKAFHTYTSPGATSAPRVGLFANGGSWNNTTLDDVTYGGASAATSDRSQTVYFTLEDNSVTIPSQISVSSSGNGGATMNAYWLAGSTWLIRYSNNYLNTSENNGDVLIKVPDIANAANSHVQVNTYTNPGGAGQFGFGGDANVIKLSGDDNNEWVEFVYTFSSSSGTIEGGSEGNGNASSLSDLASTSSYYVSLSISDTGAGGASASGTVDVIVRGMDASHNTLATDTEATTFDASKYYRINVNAIGVDHWGWSIDGGSETMMPAGSTYFTINGADYQAAAPPGSSSPPASTFDPSDRTSWGGTNYPSSQIFFPLGTGMSTYNGYGTGNQTRFRNSGGGSWIWTNSGHTGSLQGYRAIKGRWLGYAGGLGDDDNTPVYPGYNFGFWAQPHQNPPADGIYPDGSSRPVPGNVSASSHSNIKYNGADVTDSNGIMTWERAMMGPISDLLEYNATFQGSGLTPWDIIFEHSVTMGLRSTSWSEGSDGEIGTSTFFGAAFLLLAFQDDSGYWFYSPNYI